MSLCSFDIRLHLLPDEGVHEAVVYGCTLDGVQHEAAFQQVLQLGHLAGVIFWQVPVSQHLMLKVSCGVDCSHDHNLFLSSK